jgi:drug/metabolite transporter (DMT)-like permease
MALAGADGGAVAGRTAGCRCRGLPDWLGLIGGFSFALNNVMLRREAHQPEAARALAMFFGGASGGRRAVALVLSAAGRRCRYRPAPAWALGAAGAAALALVFLVRQPGAAVRRRAADRPT